MHIEIKPNPNCAESQEFIFNELGSAAAIRGILVGDEGKETECDVAGVEADGRWISATATKIADSSDGIAYMIRGGAWGIRLRPEKFRHEGWDLASKHQWGEPYKIYGKKEDILYGAMPEGSDHGG